MPSEQSASRQPSRVRQSTATMRPRASRRYSMRPPCASVCSTRCSYFEMFTEKFRHRGKQPTRLHGQRRRRDPGVKGQMPLRRLAGGNLGHNFRESRYMVQRVCAREPSLKSDVLSYFSIRHLRRVSERSGGGAEALERLISANPAELPDEVTLIRKRPPPERGPGVDDKPSRTGRKRPPRPIRT